MQKETVLITGIYGQDAHYLANLHLDKGALVVGLTRKKRSSVDRRQNLEIEESDYSYGQLSETLERHSFTRIYHLCGQSLVSKSWEFVNETVESQSMITMEFLKILSETKSIDTRFVQASSSEIFFSDCVNPIDEESKIQPVNPYGCAKAFAFHLVNMYRSKFGLHASNAILFPHESVRRDEGFACKKTISTLAKIAHGRKEKLYLGKLDVIRDWGYAQEYVEALYLMGEAKQPDNFCICTSHAMSLKEIVDICLNYFNLVFDQCVEVDKELHRYFDYDLIFGNNTKIAQQLGWRPVLIGKALVLQLIEDELKKENMQ